MIEFLMVVVVIAMTASLAVPRLTAARQTSSDAQARAELQAAYEAVSDYYLDQTSTAGSTFQGLTAAAGGSLQTVAPDTYSKWTWGNNTAVAPSTSPPKQIAIIGGGGSCPAGAATAWDPDAAECTGTASPTTVTLCNAGQTMVYCIVDKGSGPKWGAAKSTNPGNATADRAARHAALDNAAAATGAAKGCQRSGTAAALYAATGHCPIAEAGVPVVNGAPVPSGPPSVTWTGGIAQRGETARASNALGVWSNAPTSYTLQWVRCDRSGSGCIDIASASCTRTPVQLKNDDLSRDLGCRYTATAADVESTLRAKVSATNGSGTSQAMSPPTDVIVAATPVHVASASNGTTSASSLTVTKPAGTVAGDVMVAAVAAKEDVGFTGPQGWTRLAATSTNGSDHKNVTVWYRVAAAGEPANYTWTPTDDARITATISTFRGATTSGLPVVAVQRDLKTADKPLTVPPISPAAGARLVTAEFTIATADAGCAACSPTVNAPAPGMTKRVQRANPTAGALHAAAWISDAAASWPAEITATHPLPSNVIVALVLTP